MDDNELKAKSYNIIILQNAGILLSIIICTISVAWLTGTPFGLGSVIMLMCWSTPTDGSIDCD